MSTSETLNGYLDQLGSIPLLTAEEEVDLAKRRAAGEYAKTLLDDATPARRARLRHVIADGEAATRRLTNANLRLVVSVAGRYRRSGIDFADIVQEGNLGLMKAVARFDHRKGFRFSTYAMWWIRQSITRGLADRSRLVRLPAHVDELVGKLRRKESDLYQRLGREPNDDELAAVCDVPVERLRAIRRAARDVMSLDAPVGGDDATVHDFVANSDQGPEAQVGTVVRDEIIEGVLNQLSERHRTVLMLRYGLDGQDPRTLEDVGEAIGVSRERARQLEVNALRLVRRLTAGQMGSAEDASLLLTA
ncbi:MAG: sigma-70 family RNA polymerase sigma factor [Nitriliruptorales bacterium]|nr:sigma-70 family RNA polymerase sigma factor [Nitriliruptorales bacterium]